MTTNYAIRDLFIIFCLVVWMFSILHGECLPHTRQCYHYTNQTDILVVYVYLNSEINKAVSMVMMLKEKRDVRLKKQFETVPLLNGQNTISPYASSTK